MKSLEILYMRALRLGHSEAEARLFCNLAFDMLKAKGRFALELGGGWVFGMMTPHGVVLGR
jgi:hypothetical protein